MNARAAILVARGASREDPRRESPSQIGRQIGRRATAWARKLERAMGGSIVFAPAFVPTRKLLDAAGKSGAGWIVTEPAPEALLGAHLEPFDADYALLVRRAPAAVLSVQPWAETPPAGLRTAVAGVDRSEDARSAARAAAEILSSETSPGRLVLVHGTTTHPDELAATTAWSQLRQRMQLEAHPWLLELAQALRSDALHVDVAVQPTWAPDLVGGMARRESADFVVLGVSGRREGASPHTLGSFHQRVLRSTACPLLTASAMSGLGD